MPKRDLKGESQVLEVTGLSMVPQTQTNNNTTNSSFIIRALMYQLQVADPMKMQCHIYESPHTNESQ